MRGLFVICALFAVSATAQNAGPTVVFSETFDDPALPQWRGQRPAQVSIVKDRGPEGHPALTIHAPQRANATFAAQLPVDQVAGKGVLLDVWRRADAVRTGIEHYHNAKTMLSWKAASAANPRYSTTIYSDFSGTFDWERHRYVVEMPEDLEWAAVSIGLQGCSGTASWAQLSVSVDPRFPSQDALQRFLERQQREAFAAISPDDLTVSVLPGGIVDVCLGQRRVPRPYWTDPVRDAVLAATSAITSEPLPENGHCAERMAQAMRERTAVLLKGLPSLEQQAAADRTYEIAGLRARVRALNDHLPNARPVHVNVDADAAQAVSPLLFGNNINTQNLSAPYDSERDCFQEGFLERVRPMGVTFLRYPGGCNADVFDWRDTVGPLEERRDLINYHNGTSRGIPRFGVDEYLRFCEDEGITPIITTAFCKDHPSKVDPHDHPSGIRHPYVIDYLKRAPDRVPLAADWVEYCNGSVDTPMGALRAKNGHPEPYGVAYWEVGNESYGPDPTGSCSAEDYARAFPQYVKAMKERDPAIKVVMNGGPSMEWNETILKLAGSHADAFQFHIYLTPRVANYAKLEGQPHQISDGMRLADGMPGKLAGVAALMEKHLGRTIPIIISEFGMGNARNREFMTSATSAVLVADMWRNLIESPGVLGANKWCLYSGYWFSQIQGPTTTNPSAPYYNRPEHTVHAIYAQCRGTHVLPSSSDDEGVRAVVFQRDDSYRVVLISRETVQWQKVTVNLPAAVRGNAKAVLMTATHPFLGNEHDHHLIQPYDIAWRFDPEDPVPLPPNAVMGLILPR